ncbi:MAG: Co2+/Mg2+ efflux protein ApaG [Pseudomonadota bacterium]
MTDLKNDPYHFDIDVQTEYIQDQSEPEESRFVFAYTISIENAGTKSAMLLNRHWIITDANGETVEVKGQGVVGQQPLIEPGQRFEYTSGAVLTTPIGSMSGSYEMQGEDGQSFKADIPAFSLALPSMLH